MAQKVGVDKETWDSVVDKQNQAVADIQALTAEELSKTTLTRFKNMIALEAKFNEVLTSLKTYTQGSTARMKQAGELIIQEDQKAASEIEKNGFHKPSFK